MKRLISSLIHIPETSWLMYKFIENINTDLSICQMLFKVSYIHLMLTTALLGSYDYSFHLTKRKWKLRKTN